MNGHHQFDSLSPKSAKLGIRQVWSSSTLRRRGFAAVHIGWSEKIEIAAPFSDPDLICRKGLIRHQE
jgi:hypothetical protein